MLIKLPPFITYLTVKSPPYRNDEQYILAADVGEDSFDLGIREAAAAIIRQIMEDDGTRIQECQVEFTSKPICELCDLLRSKDSKNE